jgi:hypothetical protein
LNLDLNFYSPENFWLEVYQRVLGGFLMMVLYYLWFHLIPNFVPASVYAKFILVAVALLITWLISVIKNSSHSTCMTSDSGDTTPITPIIAPIHNNTAPINEKHENVIVSMHRDSDITANMSIIEIESCKPFSLSLSLISETIHRENPNVKEQPQSSEDDDDVDYLTTPIEASDEDYHKRNVVCCDLILVSNGMVTGKSIDTG